jgi:Glycosyltransferase family 87
VTHELSPVGVRKGWLWPQSARKARVHAILMAIVLWAALVFTFAAGAGDRSLAGPIKGPDFLQFYTMGSLVRTGQTAALYDMEAFHRAQVALVAESAPELYPPVYPPHAALLFSPFSRLSFRPAMFLWSLVTVVIFGAIVRSAWRPVAAVLPDSLFVFAAAAAFPPFWSLVLHGQVTILILTALWAGWMALERQRPLLAGMAFGLLLVKPQFAIPIAVVVLACREWRMLGGALLSIGIQAGIAVSLLGWSVLKAYVAFMPVMLKHADLLEAKPYQSHSLRALTRLAPDWIGLPVWALLSAIVLVYVVNAWKSNAPLRVRLGVVILASVLVNPHLIVYDAAVLVLPLLWFGAYVQERRQPADARVFWTTVYWLCLTFLAPTAAALGVQASVLLMAWLMVLMARLVAGGEVIAVRDRRMARVGVYEVTY